MIKGYDDFLLEKYLSDLDECINESLFNNKFNFKKIFNIINNIKDKKQIFIKYFKKLNNIKNINKKRYLIYVLIILKLSIFISNKIEEDKFLQSKIENTVLEFTNDNDTKKISIEDITKMSNKIKNDNDTKKISIEDITKMSNKIKNDNDIKKINKDEDNKNSDMIIKTSKKGFIDSVNNVKSGRFSSKYIDRYDKYDNIILKSLNELEKKGEKPDYNLIKTIMLIETGMKPVKNSKGYEGFPQTKQHIVDYINKKYNTNFTIKDMYDSGKSSQFIHYYLKSLKKSKHIKSDKDLIIAYNWGVGNLGKYKNNKADLPNETLDYVNLYNSIKKYYPN